jgi:hypothetical protein
MGSTMDVTYGAMFIGGTHWTQYINYIPTHSSSVICNLVRVPVPVIFVANDWHIHSFQGVLTVQAYPSFS